jgi:hypothetical protein
VPQVGIPPGIGDSCQHNQQKRNTLSNKKIRKGTTNSLGDYAYGESNLEPLTKRKNKKRIKSVCRQKNSAKRNRKENVPRKEVGIS